jgi:hypothetical protein
MSKKILIVFALLLVVVTGVSAQNIIEPAATAEVDPNINITWPPPVYVLRGDFDVRGTANVPGMASYFIEFRLLTPDLTPADQNVPWIPAILPSPGPVVDNVLGTWNTTVVPDGMYELRLTVNITGAAPEITRVSPVRVENNPPPFAITPTPPAGLPTNVPVPTQSQSIPTLFPTPTAFDTAPQAEATTNANVRAGDDTSYRVVGSLFAGQVVPVVGRSSTGSGWWVIELPNGVQGFAAPSVLRITGDTRNLPRIGPPATPTPVATATPDLPDLTITGVRFDRDITEGENFQTIVTVRNLTGNGVGRFSVACNFTFEDDDIDNQFFSGFVDSLGGNAQVDMNLVVRLDEGGGDDITANCAVDVNNLIAEVREDNNFFNLSGELDNP